MNRLYDAIQSDRPHIAFAMYVVVMHPVLQEQPDLYQYQARKQT